MSRQAVECRDRGLLLHQDDGRRQGTSPLAHTSQSNYVARWEQIAFTGSRPNRMTKAPRPCGQLHSRRLFRVSSAPPCESLWLGGVFGGAVACALTRHNMVRATPAGWSDWRGSMLERSCHLLSIVHLSTPPILLLNTPGDKYTCAGAQALNLLRLTVLLGALGVASCNRLVRHLLDRSQSACGASCMTSCREPRGPPMCRSIAATRPAGGRSQRTMFKGAVGAHDADHGRVPCASSAVHVSQTGSAH